MWLEHNKQEANGNLTILKGFYILSQEQWKVIEKIQAEKLHDLNAHLWKISLAVP